MIKSKVRLALVSLTCAISVAGSFALFAQAADGVPTADVIPLGQSERTGNVCQAIRDWDDPVAQVPGARVWKIRCRGWPGNLGSLYAFRDKNSLENISDQGVWRSGLKARVNCEDARKSNITGLVNSNLQSCQLIEGGVSYLAYTATNNRVTVAGDGYAAIADIIEVGLGIISGRRAPPKSALTKVGGSVVDAKDTSLLSTIANSRQSVEAVRVQAYLQNQSWFFETSEGAFRTLANDQTLSENSRIEAHLNWALQVSNLGRFEASSQLFEQVIPRVQASNDNRLLTTLLIYQALNERNQRNFPAAVGFAEQAVKLSSSLSTGAFNESIEIETGNRGEIIVSKRVSDALNGVGGASGFSRRKLSDEERQKIQTAQALQILASAQVALGDTARASKNLTEAQQILDAPALVRSSVWLKAQINSELARLMIAGSKPVDGVNLLRTSLQLLSRSTADGGLPGSQAEAATTLELARGLAISGQKIEAIEVYERGLTMYRDIGGSLASSASTLEPYFALLLSEQNSSRLGQERFFKAMQSIVSPSTAETVAKLSAQLSANNTTGSNIARALEDTRLNLRVQQGLVQELQTQRTDNNVLLNPALEKLASLEAEERGLLAQLLESNPGYSQFLITTVSIEDVQKNLRPGEIYYKTVLLNSKGYSIAITPDKVVPMEIPLNSNSAKSAVAVVRRSLDVLNVLDDGEADLSNFNVAASHKLYEALFSKISNEINAASHLIFDPDGALTSLPVGILVRDKESVDKVETRIDQIIKGESDFLSYEGLNWFGRDLASTLAVSASSFIQARAFAPSSANQAFIGFGDPVPASLADERAYQSVLTSARSATVGPDNCRSERDAIGKMPRLPGAGEEIAQVGTQLGADGEQKIVGANFTDGAIQRRADLDQYRIVFFGTHTVLPSANSCISEPALLTSLDTSTGDGLLGTSEITSLKLNAELVVLSACNTGGAVAAQGGAASGIVANGEALGGLARSFIYAGSRGLLVSHWNANDASTRDLMVSAFDKSSPAAETQSMALRRAQVRIMDNPETSHPYFWGAFTLVGDGGRPMKRGT